MHKRKLESRIPTNERLAHTVAHTCSILDLSRGTLHKMMANGELQSIKIGRRRLILRESIEALLQPQPNDLAQRRRNEREAW